MSGPTLDSAFGVETMIGMVKTFDTSAYDASFSNLFRGSQQPPDQGGESVSWDELQSDRSLAPVTGADSPSVPVKDQTRIKRQAFLASIKISSEISGRKLFRERAPGSLLPNAEAVLASELKNLVDRVRKTINYLSVNLLLGSLVMSNTTIPGTTMTFPTITPGVSTYAKTASWATDTTKIVSSEFQKLTNAYVSKAGRLPGLAIINDVTETYLTGNTEVQDWAATMYGLAALTANPASPQVFGGIALAGLSWRKDPHGYVPVSADGTYDPAAFVRYMPTGQAIILPPAGELGDILAMCENKPLIPQAAIGANTPNGLIAEAPSAGIAAWAELITSPVGVRIHVVWEGLPILKFPKAAMNATLL